MFETTVKAFIDLPVPFVYEYLRKMENQIHFNSSIQSVEKLSDQSYKIKIDLGIMTLNETYTIVKEEPQVFFEAECKSNGMNFKDRYQLSSENGGTQITIIDQMELKGLFQLSEFLVKMNLKNQMESNLQNLLKCLKESYKTS